MTVTIQQATDQLIQAIREEMLAKLVVHFDGISKRPAEPVAKYGRKRDPAEIDSLTEALYARIVQVPGQRMEQLSAALGCETKDLLIPSRRLLDKRMVRTTGQRRATQYYDYGSKR
jgi:hypothetical protein